GNNNTNNINAIVNEGRIATEVNQTNITNQRAGISIGLATVGSITNRGTISGPIGIDINGLDSLASIDNEAGATITGEVASIRIGTINSGARVITNAGTLDGDAALGPATLNLTGTTARVIGDVSGAAGSIVDVQGTFTSEGTFSVDTFGVASGGSLTLGHDVTATSGVTNAGTVDIGGGTISITGDYTQAAGGGLALEVASTSNHGTLAVSGVADIAASGALTVDVSGATNLADGATIADVITAASINGTAVSVSDNSAILDFTGTVNGAAVDLTAHANSLGTVLAGTSTAPGVDPAIASSLDTIFGNSTLSGSSDIFGALMSLGTASDINRAMGQLDPSLGASAARVGLVNVRAGANRVIGDRLAHLAGHGGSG
ncbi:MAG: hypothetical protein KDF64_20025, partial [Geminicoccaceae bacterium]|nr:hypothetical protein [Geminicoccaceae bacterium]